MRGCCRSCSVEGGGEIPSRGRRALAGVVQQASPSRQQQSRRRSSSQRSPAFLACISASLISSSVCAFRHRPRPSAQVLEHSWACEPRAGNLNIRLGTRASATSSPEALLQWASEPHSSPQQHLDTDTVTSPCHARSACSPACSDTTPSLLPTPLQPLLRPPAPSRHGSGGEASPRDLLAGANIPQRAGTSFARSVAVPRPRARGAIGAVRACSGGRGCRGGAGAGRWKGTFAESHRPRVHAEETGGEQAQRRGGRCAPPSLSCGRNDAPPLRAPALPPLPPFLPAPAPTPLLTGNSRASRQGAA